MKIQKLYLKNFRNFDEKLIQFSDTTTVIIGPNASGKTNILESIYLLSTGKSSKAGVEEEMITHQTEIGRVKGLFRRGTWKILEKHEKEEEVAERDEMRLEVVLTRGEITVGDDGKKENVAKKSLKVNGVGKRLVDFAGTFKSVLFGPQDLYLVTESPSTRRNYLDSVLSQVDKEYRRATLSYSKALRNRNKLLLQIREEGIPRSQLLFWDKLLIKNGDYIAGKRQEFIEFVNLVEPLRDHSFSLEYDKSAISEARLKQYADEEVAAATTLVGPHRDDFIFMIDKSTHSAEEARELDKYGSRGEQRFGVLWIKLAELAYIQKETEEKPTLLLDDIFSELDHEHRDIVGEIVEDQQTIITTADPHYVSDLQGVEKIRLNEK